MAVPRHKHTRSSVGQRRMHIFINPAALATCSKCGKAVRPHTMCANCGFYKGKAVVDVMAKLTKREQKMKKEEIKSAENSK